MADMLPANNIAHLLREHKGQNVILLDLKRINNWTDYFIIATVSSKTHMDGIERHLIDYCRKNEIEIFGSSGKKAASGSSNNEWRIIDLGWAVVHLMTNETREFYDLERLWQF